MNRARSLKNYRLLSGAGQLYATMSRRRRRQFWILLALLLGSACAELLTLGSVLPLLLLLSGGAANQFPLARWSFAALGVHPAHERLVLAAGLFVLAAMAAAALRLQLAGLSQKFAFGVGHDLAVAIQERLLDQPYAFHVAHGTAGAVAALDKAGTIASGILFQQVQSFIAASLAIVILSGLFWFEPAAALLCATALSIIYVIAACVVRRRLHDNSAALRSAFERRVRIVHESFGAIRELIIDDLRTVYADAFRRADRALLRARADTAFIAVAPRFIIEAFAIAIFVAAAVAISSGGAKTSVTIPVLGMLALGVQRLLPLAQQVYSNWSLAAGNRSIIDEVIRLSRLARHGGAGGPFADTPLGLSNSIRFDRVAFAYPGRTATVIHDVHFEIRRGECVGLTGRSGSGKSTVSDLLIGLLAPCTGQILIDGMPLDHGVRDRWFKSIAHISQSIFLANDSIIRNIALGARAEEIDLQKVVEAASIAKLDEFVMELPQGLDTVVGERGIAISGGQRQKIGIARAIYKNAPVLILDEATGALDEETEAAILGDLLDRRKDMTVLMISHRRSALRFADRIVRIECGRIVEVERKRRCANGDIAYASR